MPEGKEHQRAVMIFLFKIPCPDCAARLLQRSSTPVVGTTNPELSRSTSKKSDIEKLKSESLLGFYENVQSMKKIMKKEF